MKNKFQPNAHSAGITFRNIDYKLFKLFLTSLLWRASVSIQIPFSKVQLHRDWEEEARLSVLYDKPLTPLKLGCKLSKLHDPTPGGTFTEKSLKQVIISPKPRKNKQSISFVFTLEGYLLEFFAPAIPYKESKQSGVFKKGSVFLIPYQSVTKVPEILDFMMEALEKDQKGMTDMVRRNKQKSP